MRTIINAIFSLNNGGLQWRNAAQRNLDSKYLPWQTVFYHFTQFKERGIWENILNTVIENERKRQGKQDTPSLLAIDSQSDRRPVLKKFNSRMKKRVLMVVKMSMDEKEPFWLIALVFFGQ